MRNRSSADNITLVILAIGVLMIIFSSLKSYEKPAKGYTVSEFETQKY